MSELEKASPQEPASTPNDDALAAATGRPDGATSKFAKSWRAFERALVRYNFEARGIQRVLPDQRHDMRQLGLMQILLLWFSINLAANNLTLGVCEPSTLLRCNC